MKHRVLVADDDESMRKLLSTVLTMRGFEVVLAKDGRDAVAQAKGLKPALIIMDVDMPGMDGLSALETLKKDPATRATPVLVISGLPGAVISPEAFKEGAIGFLEKPFEPAALAQEVRLTLLKGGIKSDLG